MPPSTPRAYGAAPIAAYRPTGACAYAIISCVLIAPIGHAGSEFNSGSSQ